MKVYWLFFMLFFSNLSFTSAQTKVGKIDLENDQQIHVLTLKDGTRYVGRISSMNGKKIVFQLSGVEDAPKLDVRRREVSIIGSFTPSDDNGGALRPPFDWIHEDFPHIKLDTKLEVKNHSQQVKVVVDEEAHFGRIRQVRKGGISLLNNGNTEFYRFVNLSEISVIDWSYLDIENEDDLQHFDFQVDTFPDTGFMGKLEPGFQIGDPAQKHVLYTQVGNRFNGRVVEIDESELLFSMNNETLINFDETEVKKVEVHPIGFLRKERSGEPVFVKRKDFLDDDYILAQSRLYVSQTGFGIKKGEVEYRAIEVFVNEMSYGITDNISIGGGVYPILVANVFTFKANINKDIGKFIHLSVGGQIFADIGGLDSSSGGEGAYLGFAVASLGTPSHFINVAYNRWTGFDGFDKGDLFSLGGSFRVSRKFRIFADYFFIFDDSNEEDFFFFEEPSLESQPVLISGASWFNKFHKVDFGLAVIPSTDVTDASQVVMFPIVSYLRRF